MIAGTCQKSSNDDDSAPVETWSWWTNHRTYMNSSVCSGNTEVILI